MRNISILLLLLAILFTACQNQKSEKQETISAQQAEHNHDENTSCDMETPKNTEHNEDEIIFTKAQAAKTNFEVQEIHPKTFHQIVKTTGQILPAPGDEAIIVATSNGVVSYNSQQLLEGSSVKKGETLFHISSRNMAEGDYYSKLKIAYETARNNYERAKSLIDDKIISQKEYETLQMEYKNAKIAFDAIAVNKTAKGVGITAPISGYVKNILIREGEYVTVGQPIATLSQNKRLVLRAEVSEKYYNALKNISSANFQTSYDNKIYSLKELNGRLLSYGKTSDKDSFYVPISFEFDNKGEIIPGSFVEVFLISSPIANALTVPVSALTNEMGIFYIYIQLDEEGYRKQEVTLGANNGKEVQVIRGIKTGDKVVTQGAYQVKMAANSGIIPHGHTH